MRWQVRQERHKFLVNGGYLTGPTNYLFSFLGMAPKDDPELIVYVAVQQPEYWKLR